jgi:hypothetical protein
VNGAAGNSKTQISLDLSHRAAFLNELRPFLLALSARAVVAHCERTSLLPLHAPSESSGADRPAYWPRFYIGKHRGRVRVIDADESRAAKIPESYNCPGFFGIDDTELLLRVKEQRG